MQNRMWKQEEQPQSVTFACQSLWQAYSTNKVALCIQKLTGSRRANSTQLLTTIFSLSSVPQNSARNRVTSVNACANLCKFRVEEHRGSHQLLFCSVLFFFCG